MGLNIAGGNDWTNIIIPGEAKGSEFHHEKTFLLVDLVSEAQYECLVQAKNQYGWSEPSRIHRFLTHSNAFGKSHLLKRVVRQCQVRTGPKMEGHSTSN